MHKYRFKLAVFTLLFSVFSFVPQALAQVTHEVYLYVDKPGIFGAGHAWIGLRPSTGAGAGQLWCGGLYPGSSGLSGARNSRGVIRDDSRHGYTHRLCWRVDTPTYNAIVDDITDKINNGTTYQLCPNQTAGPGTNCAGWATSKLRGNGVTAPNPNNALNYPDPYRLGVIMDNLVPGGAGPGGSIFTTSDGSVAPVGGPAQSKNYPDGGYLGYVEMGHLSSDSLGALLYTPVAVQLLGDFPVGLRGDFSILLHGLPKGSIHSVDWGDGSGFDAALNFYGHIYQEPGVYEASVLVIDDGAVQQFVLIIKVTEDAELSSEVHIEVEQYGAVETFEFAPSRYEAPSYAE